MVNLKEGTKERTIEVIVPQPNNRQQHWQVVLQRRLPEVLVHIIRTLEQLLEVVETNHERNRKPDRTPETVPTADPIPEREHILLRDPEPSNRLLVRRECNEVLRDMRLVLRGLEEPFLRRLGIRDGLLGSERLGGDDEQRALGIARAHSLGEMGTIDVRNEVSREVALRVILQRLGDHHRSEIGATDTDVDDGVDRLASISLPRPIPHRIGELLDMLEDVSDLIHTRLLGVQLPKPTKSDVQYGTVFGGVDVLSGEHLVAVFLDASLADEIEEGFEDGLGD